MNRIRKGPITDGMNWRHLHSQIERREGDVPLADQDARVRCLAGVGRRTSAASFFGKVGKKGADVAQGVLTILSMTTL